MRIAMMNLAMTMMRSSRKLCRPFPSMRISGMHADLDVLVTLSSRHNAFPTKDTYYKEKFGDRGESPAMRQQ